jgi:hypothetical protein
VCLPVSLSVFVSLFLSFCLCLSFSFSVCLSLYYVFLCLSLSIFFPQHFPSVFIFFFKYFKGSYLNYIFSEISSSQYDIEVSGMLWSEQEEKFNYLIPECQTQKQINYFIKIYLSAPFLISCLLLSPLKKERFAKQQLW